MFLPWLVAGDLDVILNENEEIGGLPVAPQEYEDFAFCINSKWLWLTEKLLQLTFTITLQH